MMPADAVESIFIDRARGSRIWDVDGNEYVDYKLGWGPVILGHSNPAVEKKVHENERKGVTYGLDNPLEVSLAEKITSLVPGAEMIRYFVTGTEATMTAIRIARAYTGREKILKFEGHYHGFHDYMLFSTGPEPKSRIGKPQPDSPGIPKALEKLVLVNQWNDFDAVESTVKKSGKDIAAIITEPIMANASVIPPLEGYLEFLRELCDKNGIVLIFDEVKTGFRVAEGGAQQLLGIKPDLTALAKAIGNGYPISAVAGAEEIMKKAGKREVLPQSTYARNVMSLAAADATLGELQKGRAHSRIRKFGSALMKGMREILQDRKVNAIVQGYPALFQVLFTKEASVNNYREFSRCDRDMFKKLQKRMLAKGIMFEGDNSEPMYTSSAHTGEDLELTLRAFDSSLSRMKT
jgi:glutamate-1-semialdehyde 2,1-aminomutase